MGDTNQILCIKNISIETLGTFKDFFLSDGYSIKEILANKKVILSEKISDYDAIFILGGPMSVNDNLEYIHEEINLIQAAIELDIPMMGICLGSQLIASSCGGEVYRGLKKEIGWGKVQLVNKGQNSLFKNVNSDSMEVFQWHGDTFSLPSDADILSESDLYIQAFRFKKAFGVQFHLEVTKSMINTWIHAYRKELDNEKINKEEIFRNVDANISKLQNVSKIVYENFESII